MGLKIFRKKQPPKKNQLNRVNSRLDHLEDRVGLLEKQRAIIKRGE